MRRRLAFLGWTLAGAGLAAPPAAPPPTFAGAADIQRMIARAAESIAPGAPFHNQPLIGFAPYAATLEYRRAAAPPSVHPDRAELVFVVDGHGTVVEGGRLIDPKPARGTDLTGSDIADGAERQIGPGDVFVVAEGRPHAFTKIDRRLVLITVKLPRGRPLP